MRKKFVTGSGVRRAAPGLHRLHPPLGVVGGLAQSHVVGILDGALAEVGRNSLKKQPRDDEAKSAQNRSDSKTDPIRNHLSCILSTLPARLCKTLDDPFHLSPSEHPAHPSRCFALYRTDPFPFFRPEAAGEFGLESKRRLGQIIRVKDTMKRRAKSEADLLDHATNNLMRALKQDMVERDGGVTREKLRKEGYSERLLGKLERS